MRSNATTFAACLSDNRRSFWIQREYLLQTIQEVGFDHVLEQYDALGENIVVAMTGIPGVWAWRALIKSSPLEDLSWMSVNTMSGRSNTTVVNASFASSAWPHTVRSVSLSMVSTKLRRINA